MIKLHTQTFTQGAQSICTGVDISGVYIPWRVLPEFVCTVSRFIYAPRVTAEGKPPEFWVLLCPHAEGAHSLGRALLLSHCSHNAGAMNITSPRELIHALPALRGAFPIDSLIVVALNNGQIQSDFMLSPWLADDSVLRIQSYLNSIENDDSVALVAIACLLDSPAAEAALRQVEDLAHTSGLHVLDLLHAFSGRWRSVLCQDETCCPAKGHPIAVDTGAVESAPVDQDLVLSVRDLSENELNSRDLAFSDLPEWPSGDREDLFEWRDNAVRSVMTLLGGSEVVEWESVAQVCSALADIRTRDGVLRRILEHEDLRPLVTTNLVRVFRAAPGKYRPAIATVVAGTAWLDGNEELARYSIDVALREDDGYSLARLLDTALVHGVPHRVWVESLTAVGYDKCLAGAA